MPVEFTPVDCDPPGRPMRYMTAEELRAQADEIEAREKRRRKLEKRDRKEAKRKARDREAVREALMRAAESGDVVAARALADLKFI